MAIEVSTAELLATSADLVCRTSEVIHELSERTRDVRSQLAKVHTTVALSRRAMLQLRDRWTYVGIMRPDVVAAYKDALWGVC